VVQAGSLEQTARAVAVESLAPQIDAGRFAVKTIVGELFVVEADAFTHGHDLVRCMLRWSAEGGGAWSESGMLALGNDRWRGSFVPEQVGLYEYTVEAWVDEAATWLKDLGRRAQAGPVDAVEWRVGADIMRRAAALAAAPGSRSRLATAARSLERGGSVSPSRLAAWVEEAGAHLGRENSTRLAPLRLRVDPTRAAFSAWYEVFPRSLGPDGGHGTLRNLERQLPRIAGLGFDVLYLPPIHPIGRSRRKGPGNRPGDPARDPGSPWAIGSAEGGHKSVHPELGDLDDLRRLVVRARRLGLEVALDLAFQCAPDHPYLEQHPSWFKRLPDGSVRHAENPPKRYEDIVPFDFASPDRLALWAELKSVCDFWIEQGIRTFRVDNPHTKPFDFWEWLLSELKREHPDLVFLSEAFTRPRVMERLAKLGFSQSYTYFAWRDRPLELRQYLTQLTRGPQRDYLRANLWPNTPDILTEYLQRGGRAAFIARLVLAATLAANYGIYGGAFEALENRAAGPESEEYLDSEKYQLRHWVADPLMLDLITRLNRARRQNPALQSDRELVFHGVDNPDLLVYSKSGADQRGALLMVVNTDPFNVQAGWTDLDLGRLGLSGEEAFVAHDLLSDESYNWRGGHNFVRLDPSRLSAHVLRLEVGDQT